MEAAITFVELFLDWLGQTTLIASVVICLILAAQKTLGHRLGPRWCHALWLVLLVRMVLPWAPSSRLSLLNLIPSRDRHVQSSKMPDIVERQQPSAPAEAPGSPEAMPERAKQDEAVIEETVAPEPQALSNSESKAEPRPIAIRRFLPILWLAGAIVIGAYILVSDLALWRIVKRERPLVNEQMLELFEECKAKMGIQSLVVVVPSSQVRSPGLFGFVRPRLLLPQDMLDSATQEEMRYIFLHELAHLKRRDIYLGWLTSLLQILHWFNPLVWLAFYRMRSDRELACDALVLTRTGQDKSQEYGGAILGLVRRFSRSRPLPAMAGVIESKSQLKRRIAMITKFNNKSYRWSPVAVILMILLACVSLPGAKYTKASDIQETQPAPLISLRRVWADADGNLQGAPSPDGRYISYVDWDTGGDIAIYEIANGRKRRLTNKDTRAESDEYAEFSRWSPDGMQIAYDWFNKEGLIELRIVGLDGSQPRILYRNEEVDWAQTYDWSPDGKQILACFSRKDGPEQIVLVSVSDGSERIVKTFDSEWPTNISFSPDGRYIVYDLAPEKGSFYRDIFLLSIDGSRETPLMKHPADDRALGWAPDGKHILFASDRTGSPDIWIMRVAEGRPQGVPRLVASSKGPFQPIRLGFTQDGSFYYGHRSNRTNVHVAEMDPSTGKIIVPPYEAINRFIGSNATPRYSPDGQHLAYVSRRPPMTMRYTTNPVGNVLCIRSLETGEERDFRPNINVFGWPRWSPDGRSVMVVAWNEERQMGYYQIDAQTGNVTPLLPPDGRILYGGHDWSIDGKTIYYGCRDSNTKKFQVCVRNLKSGIEKVLYGPGERFNIALSPDGQRLALLFSSKEKQSLSTMSASGGEPRELCNFEKGDGRVFGRNCEVAWSADGKYILYTVRNSKSDDNQVELCRILAEGGESQKLGLKMDEFVNLSVHPDGRHIAFSVRGQSSSEVWVMEDFLPRDSGK